MIFVTGDIHADIDISKLNTTNFSRQTELTKEDYLIICGDFGLVWDDSKQERYWLNWLSQKPFTTLWVDGNHENFEMLYEIPLVDKFGGKVRSVAPSVYHLNRGQVLTIDQRKFFVMGGARSHDKIYRTEHVSWWKEEMPNVEEMNQAVESLTNEGWAVDYVVTHCAPHSVQTQIASWYESDPLVKFFDHIADWLTFKHWYFGHYHVDQKFDRFTALYNTILQIE